MFHALYVASTGMEAQKTGMDTVANNIANVNTVGFRAGSAQFEDLYQETMAEPVEGALPLQRGRGAMVGGTARSFEQGNLENTGRPLDLGLEGRGMFALVDEEGNEFYSRAGNFHLDAAGRLVHASGLLLKGVLPIPQGISEVNIATDGSVQGISPASSLPVDLGSVEIAGFTNLDGLLARGGGLYEATEASGPAAYRRDMVLGEDLGFVRQGVLEASNVKMVNEMVKMLVIQRAYELNAKVMSAADNMMGTVTNVRR